MSYFIVSWKSKIDRCTTGGKIRPAAAQSLRGAQREARKARDSGPRRGGAAVLNQRGEWLYEPLEHS